MKILLVPVLVFTFIFSSCEDKKKAGRSEIETNPNEVIVSKPDSLTKNDKFKKNQYPEITQDNVISFLTDYGKANPETRVKIHTEQGDIEIELFIDTPLHRANFIYLVKLGYFNETFFHRIVPNFIIQGGNADRVEVPRSRAKIGSKYLIPAEIIHNHTYGTISGAKEYRENPDKQTIPFEFFIFLGPKSSTRHLEGNYTVFGKVTKGMEVVEKIANLPADDGEWPKQNVYITAEVLE